VLPTIPATEYFDFVGPVELDYFTTMNSTGFSPGHTPKSGLPQ
jgi:hypothetical protein